MFTSTDSSEFESDTVERHSEFSTHLIEVAANIGSVEQSNRNDRWTSFSFIGESSDIVDAEQSIETSEFLRKASRFTASAIDELDHLEFRSGNQTTVEHHAMDTTCSSMEFLQQITAHSNQFHFIAIALPGCRSIVFDAAEVDEDHFCHFIQLFLHHTLLHAQMPLLGPSKLSTHILLHRQ